MPRISQLSIAVLLAVSIGALAIFFHFAEQRRATTTKLAFAGGGFLYNYRIAETRYGLSMRVVNPVPIRTLLEVTFENPAGGEPFVVTRSLGTEPGLVGVESPALPEVATGRDYAVVIRLRDRDTNAVLETHERKFRTNIDPSVMPKKPLTIGPGYHRNPESDGARPATPGGDQNAR
ncbi:MAG TPA: hypothetical protein VLA28_08205 [Afifellaceae bacterium]|nr:hypothetical protein [Afifellaceae bacterium]